MTTSDTEPCAAPDAAVDDGLTDRERRWQDRVERGGVEVVRSPSAIDAADDCCRVSRERLRSLEADAARLPALERDLRDARADADACRQRWQWECDKRRATREGTRRVHAGYTINIKRVAERIAELRGEVGTLTIERDAARREAAWVAHHATGHCTCKHADDCHAAVLSAVSKATP